MSDPFPKALTDYVAGLAAHDIEKIASTLADELLFISATRILDKSEFLGMLGTMYTAFPDWHYAHDGIEDRGQNNYAIMWRQGGTHTGTWNLPGMDPIEPTGKSVTIPPHYFYYRLVDDRLTIIFPEPVMGGAPRGILEQIGVKIPPL